MPDNPTLLRAIGRWSLAALILNSIIGTGVFILPGTIAGMLGWPGIFAWILAALVIGAMVFCFAEVASRFTGAGGAYLYAEAAFGRFAGIQIGWITYFARCITAAVQANLFTTYLGEFWPAATTRAGSIAVTTVFLGTLAVINLRSVRHGANVSNFFAVVKVVPLLIFGAMGAAWMVGGHGVVAPVGADATSGGWLRAMLLLMFGYGGFEAGLIPLAEARDPRRDAPFALITGLALVTLVYLAAQVTVLATLTDPGASARPLADSARMIIGAGGAAFMAVAAMVSVYGWLSSNMLTVPRLTTAMADRGDFPRIFAWVHPRYCTPWVSIIIFTLIGWILANQADLLQNLSLSAVSRLIPYAAVCAALPVFRWRERAVARGGQDGQDGQGGQGGQGETVSSAMFRVKGGVALAVVGVIASLVLASRMNMRELEAMAIVVAIGTGYYLLTRRTSI
jgi:amino acid transporter